MGKPRRTCASRLVTTAIAVAVATLASSELCACADEFRHGDMLEQSAGELRCDVSGETEYGVSAQRALQCIYVRAGLHTELYTGTTGITGVGLGTVPTMTLVYRVLSPRPAQLAALAGDFNAEGRDSASSGELVGGTASDIHLIRLSPTSPEAGAARSYAPLNAIAGFGYLHLIYAGRVAASGRR